MAVDDGGHTPPQPLNVYSYMKKEFTGNDYYTLTFDLALQRGSAFLFGHNPRLDTLDGLFLYPDKIQIYNDDQMTDEYILENSIAGYEPHQIKFAKDDGTLYLHIDDELVYTTNDVRFNTIGAYHTPTQVFAYFEANNFVLDTTIMPDITPTVEDYDGTVFGSDVYIALKSNVLNLVDYGMLPQGEFGNGKVLLNNIELIDTDYELEMDIKYNNSRFERLNDLEGKMQVRIYEDVSTSDSSKKYSQILCSPVPVQDSITQFTRLTDEGRMYYLTPSKTNAEYLCNPYIQYKGGVNLTSETGIGLFGLDNGYSPVYLSNGLVRAEFHRYSGYVVVSRFDEVTQQWYRCQTFHLHDEPNLELLENYSDDKGTVKFGNTKWTMWRGRPLIRVEHPNDDFRMLDLVDRVYCETMYNEFSMGFVEEHDATYSIFNPRNSVQLFPQELHIGENIRLNNFSLCLVDAKNNEYYDADVDAEIGIARISNENAIQVDMRNDGKVAVQFPDDSVYLKKPASVFTLLIEHFKQYDVTNCKVKCRGYGENGKVKEKESLQFGLWEDVQEVDLAEDGEDDEIRVTFKDVPDDVKYIDFMLILTGMGGQVTFKNLMLYQDDKEENGAGWDIDRSLVNALKVEVEFTETYFACLYDDDAEYGLGIFRPNQDSFTLRTLTKSNETVLIPYMKNYSEWDAVEKIFLEYLNSQDQVINVKWKG